VHGHREQSGYVIYNELDLYPALLALFAIGISALAARRVTPLSRVLTAVDVPDPNGRQPFAVRVSSWRVLNGQVCNELLGKEISRRTPISDYLAARLREPVGHVLSSDDEYDDSFDQLEYLLGVVSVFAYGRGPIGRFVWRHQRYGLDGLPENVLSDHEQALLDAGLFDGDPDLLAEAKATYDSRVQQSGLGF